MTNIKVLGTGCSNCKNTIKLLEAVAQEKGAGISHGIVRNQTEVRERVHHLQFR